MRLRPYQSENKNAVYEAWDSGIRNVLSVNPTGSGKTVIFSEIIKEHDAPSVAIAHRQELVSQISLALARDGVRHRIVGPKPVVRLCVNNHMDELGQSFYAPSSPCAVAGVDTLVRRGKELSNWLKSVTLWVQDEAHHVLESNKWGTAAKMFPNAKGLGVTATPERADGKGLGRWADGLFDTMIEGPQMRDLINMGYLTDYRLFAPPSDLDLSDVTTGIDGDYNKSKLKTAVRRSHVIGDVVKHYLRIAPGKLGVTFATDVETATDIAAQFNLAGVPAAVVSAKTPDAERIAILRRFKRRELLQLVNVDLFGEGFDLPAIEVVSMARPTKSYALFVQQFGRALRLMISEILMGAWDTYTDEQRRQFIAESSKPHAIIIDHVGNVGDGDGHNLPDAPRVWSLDRRSNKSRGPTDAISTCTCKNPKCVAVYENTYKFCPYCGHKPKPSERQGPHQVDGDLTEIDAETLAQMRGEIAKVDMSVADARAEMEKKYMPQIGIMAGMKRHEQRQEMQEALRASIAWWLGIHRSKGGTDSEGYRSFYNAFGIDVMSAQALKTKDALTLAHKINNHMGEIVDA